MENDFEQRQERMDENPVAVVGLVVPAVGEFGAGPVATVLPTAPSFVFDGAVAAGDVQCKGCDVLIKAFAPRFYYTPPAPYNANHTGPYCANPCPKHLEQPAEAPEQPVVSEDPGPPPEPELVLSREQLGISTLRWIYNHQNSLYSYYGDLFLLVTDKRKSRGWASRPVLWSISGFVDLDKAEMGDVIIAEGETDTVHEAIEAIEETLMAWYTGEEPPR